MPVNHEAIVNIATEDIDGDTFHSGQCDIENGAYVVVRPLDENSIPYHYSYYTGDGKPRSTEELPFSRLMYPIGDGTDDFRSWEVAGGIWTNRGFESGLVDIVCKDYVGRNPRSVKTAERTSSNFDITFRALARLARLARKSAQER